MFDAINQPHITGKIDPSAKQGIIVHNNPPPVIPPVATKKEAVEHEENKTALIVGSIAVGLVVLVIVY